MPVIRFPSRRARTVELIHRTTPRVGIFVKAQRARSTGPQAHQTPFIADEERGVRRQVFDALVRVSIVAFSVYCGLGASRAIWHLVKGLL